MDVQAVTELNPHDVLFGRTSDTVNYQGNCTFRELVQARRTEYMGTGRHRIKDEIARQIVAVIHSRGGRFLRRIESPEQVERDEGESPQRWEVVSEVDILQKVKQALREHRAGDDDVAAAAAVAGAAPPVGGHPRGVPQDAVEARELAAPPLAAVVASNAAVPVNNAHANGVVGPLSSVGNAAGLVGGQGAALGFAAAPSVHWALPITNATIQDPMLSLRLQQQQLEFQRLQQEQQREQQVNLVVASLQSIRSHVPTSRELLYQIQQQQIQHQFSLLQQQQEQRRRQEQLMSMATELQQFNSMRPLLSVLASVRPTQGQLVDPSWLNQATMASVASVQPFVASSLNPHPLLHPMVASSQLSTASAPQQVQPLPMQNPQLGPSFRFEASHPQRPNVEQLLSVPTVGASPLSSTPAGGESLSTNTLSDASPSTLTELLRLQQQLRQQAENAASPSSRQQSPAVRAQTLPSPRLEILRRPTNDASIAEPEAARAKKASLQPGESIAEPDKGQGVHTSPSSYADDKGDGDLKPRARARGGESRASPSTSSSSSDIQEKTQEPQDPDKKRSRSST